jgi:signal transduction histidine kinase
VTFFVLLAIGGRIMPQATAPEFLAILASFAVAGALPGRVLALIGWAVGAAAVLTIMIGNPYVEGASDIALTLTFCTIIWAAGLLVAERGRQAGAATEHAALVERRREADLAAATEHERARIAGELHDIVSHGLSIVILQTVAARMALSDQGADQAAEVDHRLEAVESTARDALGDMRRLLELLDPADDAVVADELAPSVGLGQLPALVCRVRRAGLRVETRYDVTGPGLPAGLDAATYRIAQEALTNALKHASDATAQLLVRADDTLVEITVTNDLATSGVVPGSAAGGYGLIGMRQRADLYGGDLEVGPRDGKFVVRARFARGGRP